MQKKSKYLSHVGLRSLRNEDPYLFELIKCKYLNKKYHRAKLHIQVRELAKSIRSKGRYLEKKKMRLKNNTQLRFRY